MVVKMGSGASITVQSTGYLNALGDALNPIVFTSFLDKATLGDSNGLASTGAAGQWGQIYFGSGAVNAMNALDYCTLKYAGYHSSSASNVYAIQFHDVGNYNGTAAKASLANLLVEHNLAGGILADYAASGTTITGCTFLDNGTFDALGIKGYDLYLGANAANVTSTGNTGAHL